MTTLAPGGRIGILGGGQLGRMLALAAANLGYRCHIYCPESDPPAGQVAADTTEAAYDNAAALARFADSVDVVTYEFENIPTSCVEQLLRYRPVYPGVKALATAQDRLLEKTYVRDLNVGTAPFAAIDSLDGFADAIALTGLPAVLKTRRFGYDGKGQARLESAGDATAAWDAVGQASSILEGFVRFEREFSVIAARSIAGDVQTYPPVENRHRNHILDTSSVPARLSDAAAAKAEDIAKRLLEGLDYVGVIAVELFDTGSDVLVNEIAPRVHNSGHWTIEGAETSQFEQHIRAICGLPLGDVGLRGDVEMQNLIGDDIDRWPEILAEPGAHLHIYGKSEARPGRKMGHVTRVRSRSKA